MAATINIQRLWDQKYRDESVPFPIDGTVGGGSSGAPFDVTDPTFAGGAIADGVTDCTAAIQAAIDAAKSDPFGANANQAHPVIFPAGVYKFSNLKLPSFTRLVGAGMETTILTRIGGSTGPAIRDKTAAEGNAGGATGIGIQDLTVNGNGTAGDGISLGVLDRSPNPSAVDYNSYGGLYRVHVHDFPTGTGFVLHSNGLTHGFLEADSCQVGLHTADGGGNSYFFVICQLNTQNEVLVDSASENFYGLQTEGNPPVPIQINGATNNFHGVYTLLGGNVTDIIHLKNTSRSNSFFGVHVDAQGHTYTNVIYDETPAVGVAASAMVPFYYQESSELSTMILPRVQLFDRGAGTPGTPPYGGVLYAQGTNLKYVDATGTTSFLAPTPPGLNDAFLDERVFTGLNNAGYRTPDAAGFDLTTGCDLRIHVDIPDVTLGGNQYLISKYEGSQKSYLLLITTAGNLQFYYTTDGTTDQVLTSTAALSDGKRWIRVVCDATGGGVATANFSTSPDGVTWSALGTAVTGTVGPFFSGTARPSVGMISDGSGVLVGSVFSAEIRNLAGTLVGKFDPRLLGAGTPTYTDTFGHVWSPASQAFLSLSATMDVSRLDPGGEGQVLTIVGGVPTWT